MIQFEWYVPVDVDSHMYIVTWGSAFESDEETARFVDEVESYWKRLVVDEFNSDDVSAREAMERFYAEQDGLAPERLFRPDLIVTEWRKLASTHNRGIQPSPPVATASAPART